MQTQDVIAEKYRLEELLGEGGWAKVFRATHLTLRKSVAIKFLSLDHLSRDKALERFANEAKVASQLSHANIVTVFDYGQLPDGQPYIVMDYIKGRSLAELNQPIPYRQAVDLFLQICRGLAYAHKQGVLHRDIKPENIMITSSDSGEQTALLLDFGLAKVVAGENEAQLTQTGETLGTPHYMSPEQCLGKPLDTRSDIYSLGCLMYEVLSGQKPFDADSLVDLVNQHLTKVPPKLRIANLQAAVPPFLDHVVMTAIAKAPVDRYQAVDQLAADLQQSVRPVTIATMLKPVTMRLERTTRSICRRPRLLAAIAIAAVGMIIAAIAVPSMTRYHPAQYQFHPTKQPATGTTMDQLNLGDLEGDYVTSAQAATHMLKQVPRALPSAAYVDTLNTIADNLLELGRYDEARLPLEKALQLCKQIGPSYATAELQATSKLALAEAGLGHHARAQALAGIATTRSLNLVGEQHPDYAQTLRALGVVYRKGKRYIEARQAFNDAITILQRSAMETDRNLLSTRVERARTQAADGNYTEANRELKLLFPLYERSASDPSWRSYLLGLQAEVAQRSGDEREALTYYEAAIAEQTKLSTISPQFADILLNYARLLRKRNLVPEANELEKQVEAMNTAMARKPDPDSFP